MTTIFDHSCQECRVAGAKVSARQNNLSLSGVWGRFCLHMETFFLYSRQPDVGVLRVIAGPWWGCCLCLCTHKPHTPASKSVSVHMWICTLTHQPTPRHLQMCSSVGSSHPSFLPFSRGHVSRSQLQALGQ